MCLNDEFNLVRPFYITSYAARAYQSPQETGETHLNFLRPLRPTYALGGFGPHVVPALTPCGEGPTVYSVLTPLGDEPTHLYPKGPEWAPGVNTNLLFLNLHRTNRILLANDVETNPGPAIMLKTQNISGMKEYNKKKRILNLAHSINKYDMGFMALQETHITKEETKSIEYMWRGGFAVSPSPGQARGTILLYSSNSFDSITEKYNDQNGRITWISGIKDEESIIVASIYAPNSRHACFYREFICDIENTIIQKQVTKVYIMGDFNLNITEKIKGKNDRSNAIKVIRRFMKRHGLCILSRSNAHTWQRGNKTSQLDFIIGNKAKCISNTIWGTEITDHALVECEMRLDQHKKGPGIPRINTEFTENPSLVNEFREEIARQIEQLNSVPHWDPHKKLEFIKTAIRSTAFQVQATFKAQRKKEKELVQGELNLLQNRLANQLAKNESSQAKITARHLESVKLDMNKILESQAKYLAQRARIQWLEKGERNNKYFLSLIKQNNAKQFIDEILVDGKSITEQGEINKNVHGFYQELYQVQDNYDATEFLDHINPQIQDNENFELTKPITLDELTLILRKSKGTTPGPDGIGNQIYKIIWDLVGKYILDAWNFSIEIGTMAPSQKESVICLLDKKGKDRRLLNNLRPITLSNCDIKLITKLYTTRITKILNRILSVEQAAYLSNRQVHDGLRLIDNCKIMCSSQNINGYLTSLDAKKAYDSISHKFIEDSLRKFGFHEKFINVTKLLYHDIHTRVNVNGYLTDKIMIQRGVKQGDALSCALFILCMETLTRKININNNVKPLKVNQTCIQKIVGYADDIAIITADKESIIESLKIYENFSMASGLFLNADKTEIMNLKKYVKESVKMKMYNKNNDIKFVNKIKICGKLFANNLQDEFAVNVREKVDKLERQLSMWSKRKLTVEGNIKVAKTFGISQIIYMLQNTHYPDKVIKEVEKKVYKFIWNGNDRIKRETLKKDYNLKGLKAPCISSLDKALKIKQILRTNNTEHSVKLFQPHPIDRGQPFIKQKSSRDPFINKAIKAYNEVGHNALSKILKCNPDVKISRNHLYYIGNYNIDTIIEIAKINPLQAIIFRKFTNELKITNLAQIPVVIRELNLDNNHIIVQTFGQLPLKLQNITNDELFRITLREDEIESFNRKNKIVININKFTAINDIKASAIFNNQCNEVESDNSEDENENPFITCRRIKHPRERMYQFLELHDKLYNNVRLHRYRIIDSPLCKTCQIPETSEHLLYECPRAKEAWVAMENEIKIQVPHEAKVRGSNDNWLNNIISLTKSVIIKDRDNPINTTLLINRIKNRSLDIKFIKNNSATARQMTEIKNLALKVTKN
jgi:hypothetical protein